MLSERIPWIDTARGIGILLVVLFHYPNINQIILYHEVGGVIQIGYMPFFFMLSGIFFTTNNPGKRLKRLLVPFFCFFLLGCVIAVVRCIFKHQVLNWSEIIQPLFGYKFTYPNQPLWFLLALTEMFVISYLLVRIGGKHNAFFISCVLGIIGFYIGRRFDRDLYYLSVSLLCMPFYLGSHVLAPCLKKSYPWWWYVLCATIAMAVFMRNPQACNVSMNHIPLSLMEFILVSITFCFALLGLAKLCDKVKMLACILHYLGRNSLIILCTHIVLIGIHPLVCKAIPVYTIAVMVSLPIIMLIEYGIIETINNRASIILGEK